MIVRVARADKPTKELKVILNLLKGSKSYILPRHFYFASLLMSQEGLVISSNELLGHFGIFQFVDTLQ